MLVIQSGHNQGATFRLGERDVTIGRDIGNLIQLHDDKVSRRHAQVRWTRGGYVIADLASYNGLYVNGERAAEAPLRVGDVLRLGETVIEVRAGAPGPKTRIASRPLSVQEIIDAGFPVDTDQALRARELNLSRFLEELERAVANRLTASECHQLAADGLGLVLTPDRCIVLYVDAYGKASPSALHASSRLSPARIRATIEVVALRAVVRTAAPVVINDLPATSDPLTGIGTVAVVPIEGPNRRLVGLLYLDSFADNRQTYLDEDVRVLEAVAKAIGATFGPG